MQLIRLASASWQFRDHTTRSTWLPAVVPGCVHRDLLRHGLIPDPFHGTNELQIQWVEHRAWEYRVEFIIAPTIWAEACIDLCADGLDTLATVLINGQEVSKTENMFCAYRWPVKKFLRQGRNEITVRFQAIASYLHGKRKGHLPRENHDPVGGGTKLRKQQSQFGWDWGPRFVTAGIWRDIRLEAWSRNRLVHVRIRQEHRSNGSVEINFLPELQRIDSSVRYVGTVMLNDKVVTTINGLRTIISDPALWWPAGQGDQPLYQVELVAQDHHGNELGRWARQIGLRKFLLDRQRDQWGESFQFIVNGRPVFAKGANWIPAHSFVAGLNRESYARDLRAAVEANMNMLRVWGGGIYEDTAFYELCDQLGLMVWQDFMFACTLYPGDRGFLQSVRQEADYQVGRLHHHACLALWCGNNEIAQLNADLLEKAKFRKAHDTLFHRVLPEAVAQNDGVTAYWPSSPWRTDGDNSRPAGERSGDTHYWDVWHLRKPVEDYANWSFRFVSEFGMQSWSSPETNAMFCAPADGNLFGRVMENHQKNRAGNSIILDYISRRYPMARDQDGLIYLAQLNQAHCVQYAVEHYRRIMPRCMGALYWQLNDCWPVTSWSSIEFSGRWKALHFAARRFYAPLLVSAYLTGSETTGIGNYRHSTVNSVQLFTVSDSPKTIRAALGWELRHVDGQVIKAGHLLVVVKPRTSQCRKTIALNRVLGRHDRDEFYLRIFLDVAGVRVSEDTCFFTASRFVSLPRPAARVKVRKVGETVVKLTVVSGVFEHRFAFELPGITHKSSDNFFDLYPGEPRTVTIHFNQSVDITKIRQVLRWRSLGAV